MENTNIIQWYRRVIDRNTGLDWSGDLYGNADVSESVETLDEAQALLDATPHKIVYVRDLDTHYTTPDTVTWWDNYIDGMEATDARETELWTLAEEILPGEEYNAKRGEYASRISEAMGGHDMESEQEARLDEINAIIAELEAM